MYRNFIDYPAIADKKIVEPATTKQTYFEKHKKAILITGAVVFLGLMILPDVMIRKYVPFVK
jgi:hypothetical protein